MKTVEKLAGKHLISFPESRGNPQLITIGKLWRATITYLQKKNTALKIFNFTGF